MRRGLLLLTGILAVGLGYAGWQAHLRSPAACQSEETLHGLHGVLSRQAHLDSFLINDVRTVSGGMFALRQDCAAQVAEIIGNTAASDLAWHAVTFSSTRPQPKGASVVTARLGDAMSLAPVVPSLWRRVIDEL